MELCVSVVAAGAVAEDSEAPAATEDARVPVRLSRAGEATARCMLPLVSVSEPVLRARLLGEDGQLLCDSGPVALSDEDWVCLSSEASSGGGALWSRLLSLVRECQDGWTICLDLKERSDSVSVLRSVHVAYANSTSKGEDPAEFGNGVLGASAADTGAQAKSMECPIAGSVLDCTDCAVVGVHPTHSALLELFRRPRGRMLEQDFWASFACGGLTATGAIASKPVDISLLPGELAQRRDELERPGHSRLRGLPWEAAMGAPLKALADTIDCLQGRGLPPVFIFMYDQAWQLLLRLQEVAAQLLGREAADMSLSVFAWALRPGDGQRIGSNFAMPHRDQSHAKCHGNLRGTAMVTTWLALVPVSTRSGCIYVLPADRDPLIAKPEDPEHMNIDGDAVRPLCEPLPCDAGDVLAWRSDLIHWGSACAEGVEQPRKSISTMFMLPGSGKSNVVTKADLESGLSMETRLRVVSRALLQYKFHYPSFEGLTLED